MVGCHHRLNVHVFEQALGVGDGHGSAVVYGISKSWTQLSGWTELILCPNHLTYFVHTGLRIPSTTQALSCQRKLIPFSLLLMLFFCSSHGGLGFLSKENVCHPRASLFYTSNILGFSSKHLQVLAQNACCVIISFFSSISPLGCELGEGKISFNVLSSVFSKMSGMEQVPINTGSMNVQMFILQMK